MHSRRTGTSTHKSESGFTLVELLVVTIIAPLIVGSLAMAITEAFGVQSSVSGSVSGTGDAAVVSSVFYQDIQSAAMITTSAAAGQCGPGTQIVGVEWNLSTSTPPIFNSIVSYNVVTSGVSSVLVRNYCDAGDSATPTSSMPVVNNVAPTLSGPTVTPAVYSAQAATGWTPTQGVTSVSFAITDQKSGYTYVLTSTPVSSGSSTVG